MTPNLTIGYMAEQTNRERLDSVAARGWMVDKAAAIRSRGSRSAPLSATIGAALVRLGQRLQGMPLTAGTPVNLADPVKAATLPAPPTVSVRIARPHNQVARAMH